jgi:hypothetical protein
MKMLVTGFLLICGLGTALDVSASDSTDVTGRWEVTTSYPGGSVRYDIAAAVGSQAHVVAKIRKQVLQQISKP